MRAGNFWARGLLAAGRTASSGREATRADYCFLVFGVAVLRVAFSPIRSRDLNKGLRRRVGSRGFLLGCGQKPVPFDIGPPAARRQLGDSRRSISCGKLEPAAWRSTPVIKRDP